jgi:hypothetical protein
MNLSKTLRVVIVTALATAALTVGVTAAVTAGAGGTNTTYYACLTTGKLTHVGTIAPTCTPPATLISWNSTTAFGKGTGTATTGVGGTACTTVGQVILTAGSTESVGGFPADGRLLLISSYTLLFSLLGTRFGGNGTTNFALPNLNAAAPNGLSYSICWSGAYP